MGVKHFILTLPAIATVSACISFYTDFPFGSVSSVANASVTSTAFVSLTPSSTFSTGNGLSMFLRRPPQNVATKDGINNQLAQGATINSTFTLLHGKVTFEVSVPSLVPGIVVAAILIAEEHDEIDIELLGGDRYHWQSNVYAPNQSDQQPLWGVFGELHNFPRSSNTISLTHAYTIDWNADRILWSVDNQVVRTLRPQQTMINGTRHYPSHAARVQLGIWDASNPLGTSQWAKGPIDWNKAPDQIRAIIRSVKVECMDS